VFVLFCFYFYCLRSSSSNNLNCFRKPGFGRIIALLCATNSTASACVRLRDDINHAATTVALRETPFVSKKIVFFKKKTKIKTKQNKTIYDLLHNVQAQHLHPFEPIVCQSLQQSKLFKALYLFYKLNSGTEMKQKVLLGNIWL
jgi:hypothetical protein